jgi:hypothetical protein
VLVFGDLLGYIRAMPGTLSVMIRRARCADQLGAMGTDRVAGRAGQLRQDPHRQVRWAARRCSFVRISRVTSGEC